MDYPNGKRARDAEDDAKRIHMVMTTGKRAKITLDGHPFAVYIDFHDNNVVDMVAVNESIDQPYLKQDTSMVYSAPCANAIAYRTCATQYPPGVFPFMELPPEIRVMIYKTIVAEDSAANQTYAGIFDPWYNHQKQHHRKGMILPTANGAFAMPGFSMRPTRPSGLPTSQHYLGAARPLVTMNPIVRAEVAQILFQVKHFDLRELTMETVCEWMWSIGQLGRDNIKSFRIEWWSSEWDSGEREDMMQHNDTAYELAQLLRSCSKLDSLDIKIPYGKGLGGSRFRRNQFGSRCELSLLRANVKARKIKIETPNEELTRWLMEGITSAEKPTISKIGHYYTSDNHTISL